MKAFRSREAGFSMIECSIGLFFILIIGSGSLLFFNSQLHVIDLARDRTFITRDGASTQMILSRLLMHSQLATVHRSLQEAQSDRAAIQNGGNFLRLHRPNLRDVVVGFQNNALGVYHEQASGSWSSTPDWHISRLPTQVVFDSTEGLIKTSVSFQGSGLNTMIFGLEGMR